MALDQDRAYRALQSRDARFDGAFFACVATTGIYCRPSCPARTPLRGNVSFVTSAGAAQRAGFRACKRCRPDATPGSAEWDVRADLVGRAMRLIGDGVVDREGVSGLARRLGYSERQVARAVQEATGAPPLALARARRAQAARTLLESTSMPVTDIAYAAGFSSVRQFNDTMVEVYATTPSGLRRRQGPVPASGSITLRLAYRTPMDLQATLRFLAAHRIDGVEDAVQTPRGWEYTRTVHLPHGPGVVTVSQGDGRSPHVRAELELTDNRDLTAAVWRIRRWLDLDADPVAVGESLSAQPVLAPIVAAHPGLRSPGTPDGFELLARTIVGQQVSLASARKVLSTITRRHGEVVTFGGRESTMFPTAETVAGLDPESLPMTRARGRSLVTAAAAVADGTVVLDGGADRGETRRALLALPGIGPWTADYVGMRALSDPDVFLAGDLAIARAWKQHSELDPQVAAPWRSYLTHYLWSDHPALRAPEAETTIGTGARTA